MKLHTLLDQLDESVNAGLMSKDEAYDQLIDFKYKMDFKLPAIPRTEVDLEQIDEFIELAHKISVKYST